MSFILLIMYWEYDSITGIHALGTQLHLMAIKKKGTFASLKSLTGRVKRFPLFQAKNYNCLNCHTTAKNDYTFRTLWVVAYRRLDGIVFLPLQFHSAEFVVGRRLTLREQLRKGIPQGNCIKKWFSTPVPCPPSPTPPVLLRRCVLGAILQEPFLKLKGKDISI